MRAADANDVYVAQGYLQSVFNKGDRTWKERTIFDFNKGIVTQLNISSPEEIVELRLDADGTWQMLKPAASAVKQDEVDSLLTTLSGLDTDDFAEVTDDLGAYGLDTPESTISAVGNDGTRQHYTSEKKKTGNFMSSVLIRMPSSNSSHRTWID